VQARFEEDAESEYKTVLQKKVALEVNHSLELQQLLADPEVVLADPPVLYV